MDIKFLLNSFITENQPVGIKTAGFERTVPTTLCESEFVANKFSYDMFGNCKGLREIDLIKKYNIGKNPIDDDDDFYCVFKDIEILSGKFGKDLLFCFAN